MRRLPAGGEGWRGLAWLAWLALLPIVAGGYAVSATRHAAPPDSGRRPVAQEGPRVVFPANDRPALTLPGGQYRNISSLLRITTPLRFGDYRWDEHGVPAGEVWVRVDLPKQIISVFRGGHEIGTSVILYGSDGKPTPSGTFHVLERATRHRSSLYDADMPYMLRLTRDGVAIHASAVHQGYATHGCIGVPLGFAQLLYAQVKRGDVVYIVPPGAAPSLS